MRPLRVLLFTIVTVAASALPAWADLTLFVGGQSAPTTRRTTGIALGTGLLILGFEGEYAQAKADDDCFTGTSTCAPSVRTVMFNVLLQTPRGTVPHAQLYFTGGGGYFRERFEALDIQHSGVGTNLGGGVKINLVGPLRVRIDYRVFKLGNDAVYSTSQRFTVGANLAF